MDLTNLPNSENVDDRRYSEPEYPSRGSVLLSLFKGLMKPSPPSLNRVETWNGDPNMQPGDTSLPPLGTRSAGMPANAPSAPPMNLTSMIDAARPYVARAASKPGAFGALYDEQPQSTPQQEPQPPGPGLIPSFLAMLNKQGPQ